MPEVPSLLTLCINAIKDEIVAGDDIIPYVYKLPTELFDCLLPYLPPVALQKLQEQLLCNGCDDHQCDGNHKKRKRFGNFGAVWKTLYESRWPREDVVDSELINDWQQMYWEAHLQNCLSAGAEILSVPSFDGYLGDVKIPDDLMKYIGQNGYQSSTVVDYSKLSYHCQLFGRYARCLRLQNVLCVDEISHLLRNCQLQSLELHWIKSKEHVEGLCKLLRQSRATLASLELVHCKLSGTFVNAICESLNMMGQTHVIKDFSIKTSSFLETSSFSLPDGIASLLSSARSLSSLNFSDNHLRRNFTKMVFDSLLDASSNIASLDLSENNITGCFSHFKWTSSNSSNLPLGISKSLQSLRVLNLRSNNLCKDDADCLRYALVHMPNLEVLNLSDNPIEDGIRSLIPYLVEISERSQLADLNLEKCELSCQGVTEFLEVLSTLKKPLNSLSLADNYLGSEVGKAIGRFLCGGIQTLDIEGIGLGSTGFVAAREEIVEDLQLVRINISKNRGMMEIAKFLSKIISQAPELVEVNARYNFMPTESLSVITSCLRVAKGKLKVLDLTGNYTCHQSTKASLLDEFQINGKPIVILQPAFSSYALYDSDP